MAHRHKMHRKSGGKVYEGAGSKVVEEAEERKHGGKVGHKVAGEKGKHHLGKRARGGRANATSSPFSSAHKGSFDAKGG